MRKEVIRLTISEENEEIFIELKSKYLKKHDVVAYLEKVICELLESKEMSFEKD